ncbi:MULTISPECIES: MurR/RpiR family transcriptional regulator [Metabacillus]|jgi:RpiR family transcriptional regulator, carbohydrate utilization regulator|uniref:RpiR family transcriptional regulator n=3 Tax=Metabacillus TaxID=2675233 RepID=A0A179SRC5_9BACI|nr:MULTISPECIES: MurR/RpiR family transcriptional regulator [Metabacillus]OAS82853.1 RpiR family transcriptional regulator [Metabacillus litoralis]QNF30297.1 MurR/RpiR family transcriptional regulator [Metabacillus sp. KUDC1714]
MRKQEQPCLVTVRKMYPKFSITERKIADYILKNPNKIIHSSINQLAEDLDVADSTVFRFCKRIGYKGYQAMKIALASEVVSPLQDIHEKVDAGDSVETIATKVFRTNIKTIEDSLSIFNEEQLQLAVDGIVASDSIHFFGSGGSSIIALDAFHKLVRTGLKVNAVIDTHFQLMAASQMSKNDCAVLISHSGSSKDILHILNVVKSTGAKTIAITNYAKSPLSAAVDIPLYTVSEETEYRSEALSSRIAQLTLIDVLYVNILMKRGSEGQDALKKMREAITVKRI